MISFSKSNAPALIESLAPRASERELCECEAQLGMALPPEVRSLYSTYNGHRTDHHAPALLGPGFVFSSLLEMVADWSINEELRLSGEDLSIETNPRETQPVIWHQRMVPIASNGGGGSIVVDCAPSEYGVVGQVLSVSFTMGAKLLSPSILGYLHDLVSAAQSGRLPFSPIEGFR